MAGEWLREPRATAGDRERELVVEVLRDASNRGQLSVTEFDQRWEYLQTARTVGELVPLVSDLPNVPSPAQRPVGRRRRAVERPSEGVTSHTPENAWAPTTRPDQPDNVPGAAMLPFDDQVSADSEGGRQRAYDGSGRRRAASDPPYEPDPRASDDPSVTRVVSEIDPDSVPDHAAAATERRQAARTVTAAPALTSGDASAADEWNTAFRACVGSFALLIAVLLLAVILS